MTKELEIKSVKVSWVGEDGVRYAEYAGDGPIAMEIDLLGITSKEQAIRVGKWQLARNLYVLVEDSVYENLYNKSTCS